MTEIELNLAAGEIRRRIHAAFPKHEVRCGEFCRCRLVAWAGNRNDAVNCLCIRSISGDCHSRTLAVPQHGFSVIGKVFVTDQNYLFVVGINAFRVRENKAERIRAADGISAKRNG